MSKRRGNNNKHKLDVSTMKLPNYVKAVRWLNGDRKVLRGYEVLIKGVWTQVGRTVAEGFSFVRTLQSRGYHILWNPEG